MNVAVLSIPTAIAIYAFGSRQGFRDYLIGIGVAAIVGLFGRPVVQLLWLYIRAPLEEVVEEVARLRGRIWELEKAVHISQGDLRAALQDIRQEVREDRRLLQEAYDSGKYWKATEPAPGSRRWKANRSYFSRQPALQPLYDSCSEAHKRLETLLQNRSGRIFTARGREVRPDDQLSAVLESFRVAEEQTNRAIEEIDERDIYK